MHEVTQRKEKQNLQKTQVNKTLSELYIDIDTTGGGIAMDCCRKVGSPPK